MSSDAGFHSAAARDLANELRFNPQFFTADELAQHNGVLRDSMLLVAVRCSAEPNYATVVDVSSGADHYGPGAPYHCFTGRDCSRAFSLVSLKTFNLHADMTGATAEEWGVLDEWHAKLTSKYPTVGMMHADAPVRLAELPERPQPAHPVLAADLVQTVQVLAERSGLCAEKIAAMLHLDVAAVEAAMTSTQVLQSSPASSLAQSTTESAVSNAVIGGESREWTEFDDADEWRIV